MNQQHPLWDSPHRLFFLLAAFWAMLAMGLWLLQWAGFNWLVNMPGGMILWHAHELIFGFASLAIIGFLLTAVPEFTHTDKASSQSLQRLAWVWGFGRLSFLIAVFFSPFLWLAAIFDTLLLALLMRLTWQPLWQDPARRHLSLFYALVLLAVVNLVFYACIKTAHAYSSLMLLSGTLMILVLLALARISMSVVNNALDDIAPDDEPYIARPPRRNLAIICIALFSVVSFLQPQGLISAWLALASSAAILAILNDWHIGKVLLRRWVLIPYLIIWVMAAGYAIQGLGILTGHAWQSAGQHLLLALAMTMAILFVLLVAGGNHSGWGLDWRSQPMWVLALFALTVGARSLAVLFPDYYQTLIWVGGLGWITSWALLLPLVWRTLLKKPDGAPVEEDDCKV